MAYQQPIQNSYTHFLSSIYDICMCQVCASCCHSFEECRKKQQQPLWIFDNTRFSNEMVLICQQINPKHICMSLHLCLCFGVCNQLAIHTLHTLCIFMCEIWSGLLNIMVLPCPPPFQRLLTTSRIQSLLGMTANLWGLRKHKPLWFPTDKRDNLPAGRTQVLVGSNTNVAYNETFWNYKG